MLTQEQIEDRRTGIGGSDLACMWNLHPNRQAIDVFFEKRPDLAQEAGYVPQEVSGFAIDRGNIFEEPVAQLVEKRTGLKLRNSNVMHRHPTANWLIANIDKKVQGVQTVLEIKTVTHHLAHQWGPEGTDEVAEYYLPQPNLYMLVLNYPTAKVAAMIGMDDLRIYDLQRDPEMDELILDTTRDFWVNHVQAGVAPPIDPEHKAAADVLRRVYRQVNSEDVTLPDEALHWHQVCKEAEAKAKEYEAVADTAKRHLEVLAGNAGKFRIPGVKGAYVREQRHRDAYQADAADWIQTRYSARFK